MKVLKASFAFLLLAVFFILPAAAESRMINSFSSYGIKTIGIYTEAYEDLRSDNFLLEYMAMQSDPWLNDPTFYNREYCNFDRTTPPLTTAEYPLAGAAKGLLDDSLVTELEGFLAGLGWKTEKIADFAGGTVSDLLTNADDSDLDAVLVVRYTPFRYFIPVESYRESSFYGNSGIITGKIQLGLGYHPALELYDAETGTRLWYSAYHSGHQVINKKLPFVENVNAAGKFFVQLDTDDKEKAAAWASGELTDDFDHVWRQYDTDELAAERMIKLAMIENEVPFPAASESAERASGLRNQTKLKHLFWSDYPSYALYGTKWGVGYTLDYIGDYGIYYQDDTNAYPGTPPVETALTLQNTLMHKITLPFYSLAFANLSIEPVFYYGHSLPISANLDYIDIKSDYSGGYTETPTTDPAEISLSSLGLNLEIKYYLRFTDKFAAYIGAAGSISSWWEDVDAEEADHDEIIERYDSLYVNYEADLLLNASVIAGVKFNSKKPFEIFGVWTPVGPGGSMMISAGLRWIPSSWGWVEPHQQYCAEDLSIF